MAPREAGEPGDVLMMTATIAPAAAMPGNLRADPALRRADYETALRFYLGLPPDSPCGLVFVENSGADLGSLRRIAETENPHGKPVRFVSFVSDVPPERGKGHAELDLLDRAFAAEGAALASGTRIWKVTGRLLVLNLPHLIATAPRDFALYADFRRVPLVGERLGGNDWMDTRLFAVTPEGYARLLAGIKDRTGWTIEKSLFAELYPRLALEPSIVPRFVVQPVIDGVCAGSNRHYRSASYRAKELLRRITRGVAPALWI